MCWCPSKLWLNEPVLVVSFWCPHIGNGPSCIYVCVKLTVVLHDNNNNSPLFILGLHILAFSTWPTPYTKVKKGIYN